MNPTGTGYHSDGSWTSSLGDVLDEDEDFGALEQEGDDEDKGALPLATMRLRGGGGGAGAGTGTGGRAVETRHPSSSTARLAPPRSSPDRRSPRKSSVANTTSPPPPPPPMAARLDLTAIDAAFGATSDLYRDVLGVKPNASPEQIQRAYFQRRNELFRLLADLDGGEYNNDDHERYHDDRVTAKKRGNAELKMDGVVMAMRVLGDPELRGKYDDVRADRLRGRANITSSSSSPARPQKAVTSEFRAHETIHVETTPTSKNAAKKATTATTAKSSAATTRKKPEDESPPSPPQPPKKKQQHQRQRDDDEPVAAAAPKTQSNAFYRRMVPGLNAKKSAAVVSSTEAKKKSDRVVVTPEKPTNRKSNDSKSKVTAAAAAAAPSVPSLRWPGQQQSQSKVQSSKSAAGTAKARGIRFDMGKSREYPAAAATSSNKDVDTDDDGFDESTADPNWTDEGTLLSEDPSEGTLTTAAASAALRKEESEKGFVVRVRDELCGAIEDTAASFDQVFNVFTLQDEDIRAVRYRIDKFRQQVSHSL